MRVNGLLLPTELVQIIRSGGDDWTLWMVKEHIMKDCVDAYGDYFDRWQPEIFDERAVAEETAELPIHFPPIDEKDATYEAENPGFIPYVRDYSKIVAFGKVASGELFCLDYRENPEEPSVIFRYFTYWRRLAPSFRAFMDLIEPFDDDEYWRRLEKYG